MKWSELFIQSVENKSDIEIHHIVWYRQFYWRLFVGKSEKLFTNREGNNSISTFESKLIYMEFSETSSSNQPRKFNENKG